MNRKIRLNFSATIIYYYQKKRIPIFVKGNTDGKNFDLIEYLEDGKQNAYFKGKVNVEKGKISGTWKSGKKEMPFSISRLPPVQNMDIIIDYYLLTRDIAYCLNKKFKINNQTTSGTLFISKKEEKKKDIYRFSFNLDSK